MNAGLEERQSFTKQWVEEGPPCKPGNLTKKKDSNRHISPTHRMQVHVLDVVIDRRPTVQTLYRVWIVQG